MQRLVMYSGADRGFQSGGGARYLRNKKKNKNRNKNFAHEAREKIFAPPKQFWPPPERKSDKKMFLLADSWLVSFPLFVGLKRSWHFSRKLHNF